MTARGTLLNTTIVSTCLESIAPQYSFLCVWPVSL